MTFKELPGRLGYLTLQPLYVAYGLGVDSTAVLIELVRRYRAGHVECRPELITFADVGGEKPETYRFLPVMQQFLQDNGFPPVTVVKYKPVRATYDNLEDNCLQNKTLPSLAFGYKKCSLKFKGQVQDKHRAGLQISKDAWAVGRQCIVTIGYDNGPKDARRSKILENEKYTYWYPLRELGWDRARCRTEIRAEGLPGWEGEEYREWLPSGGVPVKSACYYCPAMKPHEIVRLCEAHPDLGRRIIRMEENAAENNTKIEGLWRKSTKTRPGSIGEFIRRNALLPEYGGAQVGESGDTAALRVVHHGGVRIEDPYPVGTTGVCNTC